MDGELRKKWKFTMAWNYEKEEDDLNIMSQAGWHLIKATILYHIYTAEKEKRYIYKLDFQGFRVGSEKFSEYMVILKDQGFEYVDSLPNGWVYFRKEYGTEGNDEIYTDWNSYNNMITRVMILLGIAVSTLIAIDVIYLIRVYQTVDSEFSNIARIFLTHIPLIIWIIWGMFKMNKKKKR